MKLLFLGAFFLGVQLFPSTASPCSGGYRVLQESGRHLQSPFIPEKICDNTKVGWYRFKGSAGAKMADSTNMPHSKACSTTMPIYLKGTHPDPGCDAVITGEACVLFRGQTFCKPAIDIQVHVMKCCNQGTGSFYVYYLDGTPGCDMAYCGTGDGGITCSRDQRPYVEEATGIEKCKPRHPLMKKRPVISGPSVSDGSIIITCDISNDNSIGDNRTAEYFVQFLFDGQVKHNATANYTNGFRAHLDQWSLQGNLGKHISCRTKGRWKEYMNDEMKDFAYSINSIFAGVKVFKKGSTTEVSRITLSLSKLEPFVIQLASYIPITVKSHETSDQVQFKFVTTLADYNVQETCIATLFPGNNSLPIFSTPMTVFPVYDGTKSLGELQSRHISFDQLQYSVSPPIDARSIWHEYKLSNIPVQIEDANSAECTSSTDPRIKTFDGGYYSNQEEGEFILAKAMGHDLYFEVHQRTNNCGFGFNGYCNCGVAARENNDVFILDICKDAHIQKIIRGHEVVPNVWYRAVDDDAESFPVPDTHYIKHPGGKRFTMQFSSGARVVIAIVSRRITYLDLRVHVPSYFRQQATKVSGLCGNLNGDIRDDTPTFLPNIGSSATYFDPNVPITTPPSHVGSIIKGHHYCHCQAKNLTVCDFSQLVTDKEHVENSTDISQDIPRQIGRTSRGRRRRDLRARQDVNDNEIQDFSRFSYVFNYKENNLIPPIDKGWPTKSGKTEAHAKAYCEDKLRESPMYVLCQKVPGFDMTPIRKQCVDDIHTSDGYDFVEAAVGGMESFCLNEAGKIKIATTEPTATQPLGVSPKPTDITPTTSQLFDMPDFADLKKLFCPGRCSGEGTCVDGVCQCNSGRGSVDCSVLLDSPPVIRGIDGGGLCNVRERKCEAITLRASNLLDGPGLTCRFIMHQVDFATGSRQTVRRTYEVNGELISYAEMVCALPKQAIDTPLVATTTRGIPIQSFDLQISNDGQNFSVNSTRVTVFDSHCIRCNNHDCSLKSDACLINGYCYENGETDPVNEACRVCDVAVSTTWWANRTEPPSPCSQCDGVPCTCSGTKWKCQCKTGFRSDGNGLCRDVNECLKKDICGPNATCVNTDGSYVCQCKTGFGKSNGTMCSDINECAQVNICGPYADCVNTEGSYSCTYRSSGCPLHYVNIANRCYNIQDTGRAFPQARAVCRNEGGDLAMIRSLPEYKYLVAKIPRKSASLYWIGITDLESEGTFKFVDGTAVGYNPGWVGGRPADQPSDADCIAINPGNSYNYVDKPCYETNGFICQAPWRQPDIAIG